MVRRGRRPILAGVRVQRVDFVCKSARKHLIYFKMLRLCFTQSKTYLLFSQSSRFLIPVLFPSFPFTRCRNLCVPPPPPVDDRWHCSVWGPWFCLTGIVTAGRAEKLAGYWAHGCGGCEGCQAEKKGIKRQATALQFVYSLA